MASRPSRRYIKSMTDPTPSQRFLRKRRFRPIPVRMLVPNIITLLSVCAGLTAIRFSVEGRLELALAAIVFAAMLDGIDGRIARLIKGQSKFGAELDSLADFVNFGVTPALLLYFWQLNALGNVGWIAAIIFAICGGLRLARFNATLDDPNKPAFAANFFTGVPAPAGAITVLLPVYLSFIDVPKLPPLIVAVYTLTIGFLMVSRLPVLSGKTLGSRVEPDKVLPVVVIAVVLIVLLISYPWHVMATVSVLYLLSLPFGWMSWQRHVERANAAAQVMQPAPGAADEPPAIERPAASEPERPARLN